jgi:hypothetical protein
VVEKEILSFVQAAMRSVWSLELLLFLRRNRQRSWQDGELIRELRGSEMIVSRAIQDMRLVGLAARDENGTVYLPLSPALENMADEIEKLYAAKPMTVIDAIVKAPDEKLRLFSDAFKLKDRR